MVGVNTCSNYKVHHHVVLNSLYRFHLSVINRKSCLVYFTGGLPEAPRLWPQFGLWSKPEPSRLLTHAHVARLPVSPWSIRSPPASSLVAPAAHSPCSCLHSWRVWSWGSAETKPQDVTSTSSSSELAHAAVTLVTLPLPAFQLQLVKPSGCRHFIFARKLHTHTQRGNNDKHKHNPVI